MKPIIYCLCLFIACAAAALNPNWRLAWSDEFDTLDTTKWNIRHMGGNYGNGELQWYHPNQTSVVSGNLVITAIKQAFGGQQYMSSRLDSQDKAMFTYGRYEVRAKMAKGKGTWPAMWILSQNKCWALGAEVDIAEFIGKNPTNIGNYYHYATQCCAIFGSCISSKGSAINTGMDLTADFHTYALEWWPGNMTWFLDGVVKTSYQTSSLTTTQDVSPHYWILNLAIGGGYPGSPDASTVFPLYHQIDYVRNYVWRTTCSGETCSSHGCCDTKTLLCKCDDGWVGAKCEQNVGSITNNFNAITSLDRIPNGWGNAYTMYSQTQAVISSGAIKLTHTNSGCPTNCYGGTYASGAWESIPRWTYGTFTFQAKSTRISGTALSLSAAGENELLEQIAFVLLGSNPTTAQLFTWSSNYVYVQTTINLGFDASAGYHTYAFTYNPTNVQWYVDGQLVFTSTLVQPQAKRLAPGAYYTAQPDWYGPFTYNGASSTYVTKMTWQIAPLNTAKC